MPLVSTCRHSAAYLTSGNMIHLSSSCLQLGLHPLLCRAFRHYTTHIALAAYAAINRPLPSSPPQRAALQLITVDAGQSKSILVSRRLVCVD